MKKVPEFNQEINNNSNNYNYHSNNNNYSNYNNAKKVKSKDKENNKLVFKLATIMRQ